MNISIIFFKHNKYKVARKCSPLSREEILNRSRTKDCPNIGVTRLNYVNESDGKGQSNVHIWVFSTERRKIFKKELNGNATPEKYNIREKFL